MYDEGYDDNEGSDMSYGDENIDDVFNEDGNGEGEEEEREDKDDKGDVDIIEDGETNNPMKGAKPLSKEERITTPYLTKYEKARVLGARALQISRNAPVMIDLEPGEWDPLEIAEKELRARKIPFIIRRYLPNNTYEDWKVSELAFD